MIITAHQPNYLPWIGLFHKICLADRHIIYDDVELPHYGFVNRTDILGKDGVKTLTVPIHRQTHRNHRILDIHIDKSNDRWRRKHWMSMVFAYKRARYFECYSYEFETIYNRSWDKLFDLNFHLLKLILDCLGIKTSIERASSLGLQGQKTDRVIDLCRKLDASTFIFGSGGRKYTDLESFWQADVEPLFQQIGYPLRSRDVNMLGWRTRHPIPKAGSTTRAP